MIENADPLIEAAKKSSENLDLLNELFGPEKCVLFSHALMRKVSSFILSFLLTCIITVS